MKRIVVALMKMIWISFVACCYLQPICFWISRAHLQSSGDCQCQKYPACKLASYPILHRCELNYCNYFLFCNICRDNNGGVYVLGVWQQQCHLCAKRKISNVGKHIRMHNICKIQNEQCLQKER